MEWEHRYKPGVIREGAIVIAGRPTNEYLVVGHHN